MLVTLFKHQSCKTGVSSVPWRAADPQAKHAEVLKLRLKVCLHNKSAETFAVKRGTLEVTEESQEAQRCKQLVVAQSHLKPGKTCTTFYNFERPKRVAPCPGLAGRAGMFASQASYTESCQ